MSRKNNNKRWLIPLIIVGVICISSLTQKVGDMFDIAITFMQESVSARIALIVIIALVASIAVICIVISFKKAEKKQIHTAFVLKNSKALAQLNELNCIYRFRNVEKFDLTNSYDNENFYSSSYENKQ